MRDKSKSAELVSAFRNTRKQIQASCTPSKSNPTFERGYKKTPYSTFEQKCENLTAETFNTFNAVDLTMYFRRVSEESGKKYVIANMKKDAAIFKRLMESYSPWEIALMIHFLFSPEQDYIEVPTPNVMGSSWCNTIFSDAKKWANDEPIHTQKSSKSKKKTPREWDDKSESIKIGEW